MTYYQEATPIKFRMQRKPAEPPSSRTSDDVCGFDSFLRLAPRPFRPSFSRLLFETERLQLRRFGLTICIMLVDDRIRSFRGGVELGGTRELRCFDFLIHRFGDNAPYDPGKGLVTLSSKVLAKRPYVWQAWDRRISVMPFHKDRQTVASSKP